MTMSLSVCRCTLYTTTINGNGIFIPCVKHDRARDAPRSSSISKQLTKRRKNWFAGKRANLNIDKEVDTVVRAKCRSCLVAPRKMLHDGKAIFNLRVRVNLFRLTISSSDDDAMLCLTSPSSALANFISWHDQVFDLFRKIFRVHGDAFFSLCELNRPRSLNEARAGCRNWYLDWILWWWWGGAFGNGIFSFRVPLFISFDEFQCSKFFFARIFYFHSRIPTCILFSTL